MVNPVSSGTAGCIQNTQAAKAQAAPPSNSQSSAPSSIQDTVELSSQAKGAVSGTGSNTQAGRSSYAPPSTVAAQSSRAGAAS